MNTDELRKLKEKIRYGLFTNETPEYSNYEQDYEAITDDELTCLIEMVDLEIAELEHEDDESLYVRWGKERLTKEFLQGTVLGLCGCGDPDATMAYIGTMLEKIKNETFGSYTDMAYMFFVYWASHNYFTEHGTTVRCGWLTDKGKDALELINKYKTSDK